MLKMSMRKRTALCTLKHPWGLDPHDGLERTLIYPLQVGVRRAILTGRMQLILPAKFLDCEVRRQQDGYAGCALAFPFLNSALS